MKKIIVAVLMVSLLLVAVPAMASETEDVQTEGYARMMGTQEGKGVFGLRGGMKDEGFELDADKVAERIAEAVEDGKLTQEKADEMLAKLEDGEWSLRDRMMERDPELIAEHIAQAVEDGKLSQEKADEMLAKLEAGEFPLRDRAMERDPELIAEHITQAVEDGKLTQERADELLERLEEGKPLRRTGFGAKGGRGMRFDCDAEAEQN